MTRGLHELASGLKRKVAAVFAPVEPKPHRSGLFRRTLLVTAIGLFAGAAALGMVQQPDRTELPPSRVIQSILPLTAEQVEVSSPSAAPYISETRIRPGDTLSAVLQRLELDAPNLQSFLTHDASARSIYKLYPGRSVQAATDEQGKLIWLRYIHTPGNESDGQVVTRMLHVAPAGDSYKAEEVTESTERQTRVAVGTIKSSLFGATDSAGIPDSVTMQMADILSAKIDFLRDLRQGDQFRVVYEVRSHDGRYAGAGRVLALEFINGGKTYNAVWFSPDEKTGSYYDFDGTSLRGAFLRTALKFSRISSTFGMRMHPIHKTWRAHLGTDFAAPTGTKVRTVGDGTVSFAGVQNGYGNVIFVDHANNHTTVYAHLSHIGVTRGQRVEQGDIIGNVGSTGWATGPHLHFEVRVNGEHRDPMTIVQATDAARPVSKAGRAAFDKMAAQMRIELQASNEALALATER